MNETWRKLITGLVDGELAPAEKQAADKLLRQSADARRLFRALKSQSDQLKSLPRLKAPIDLAPEVLARLRTKPTPRPTRPVSVVHWRRVLPYALAASVLLVMASVSWLVWSRFADQERLADHRKKAQPTDPFQPRRIEDGRPKLALASRDLFQVGRQIGSAVGGAAAAVALGLSEETARVARRQASDTMVAIFLGRPVRELAKKFQRLEFSLPVIGTGEEVAADFSRFVDAVRPGGLHQFDLASADPAKTVDRLTKAGEAKKIKMIVDKEAQEAIRLKKPLEYRIYLENITAEIFTEVVASFNAAEREALGGNKDATLVSAIIDKLPAEAQKQLAQNLGVPASTLTSGSLSEAPMSDNIKPSPSMTAGMAGTAVVYVYKADRKGEFRTKDIRGFLDGRAGPKPDRVSLLIVIRPVK